MVYLKGYHRFHGSSLFIMVHHGLSDHLVILLPELLLLSRFIMVFMAYHCISWYIMVYHGLCLAHSWFIVGFKNL